MLSTRHLIIQFSISPRVVKALAKYESFLGLGTRFLANSDNFDFVAVGKIRKIRAIENPVSS